MLPLLASLIIGFVLGGELLHLGFEDVGPSAWWFGDSIQSALMALDPAIDTVVVGPVWLVALVLGLSVAIARSFYGVSDSRRAWSPVFD